MPLRPNMEPSEFLVILRRRKWLIIFSFLVILFAALVYCVIIPDQYRSRAKILIIAPSVAEGMVRSTVNLSTGDRLRSIEQDILGRLRLPEVIQKIGISRLGFDAMSEDDMLWMMRNRIELEIEKNPERNPERNVNTFDLTFLHEDPKVAQEVTSSLSALFIGENIRLREAISQDTSKFLEIQLAETRDRLERQEEKIKRYKLTYGGELPQQEQANLSRLQRLQDQIKNNSDAVARLQDRKVFLESQSAALARTMRANDQNPSDPDGLVDQLVPQNLLSEHSLRKKRLDDASRKFTPLHPSVVQAKWELEQIEAEIAAVRKEALKRQSSSAGKDDSANKPVPGLQQVSPEMAEIQRLRGQIAQADLEITALKRESANAARTIDEIQRKVERLPQREQEIVSLTRDYENIKKSYDDLLDKKLKANISLNLEENQKGERFQVLEPANLPTRPSKPNRLKIIGLALLAAFAVGVGGSFGLEMLNPTLRESKEFKSYFDVPILASLPVIHDHAYKRRVALRSAAITGGVVSILGAYLVFIILHGEKIRQIVLTIASSIGGKN
ncbi:MAG: hypothetical protein IH588_03220 [Anaerolineales bacterium]|nr:hypothetical protein [Anaerolineales bacterium]